MSAWLEHDEFRAMRARYHRALAISVGVHALLGLALLLAHGARPEPPRIVEVTWLDPAPAPATPVAVAPAPRDRTPREPEPRRADEPVRPRASRTARAAAATPSPAAGEAARRERQLAALAASRPTLGGDLGPVPAPATSC